MVVGLCTRCARLIKSFGADMLDDPAIKAKFQEVVAASVRQQLEALASAPASGQQDSDRSGRHHGHRDR